MKKVLLSLVLSLSIFSLFAQEVADSVAFGTHDFVKSKRSKVTQAPIKI
jgi:hypothetical protein